MGSRRRDDPWRVASPSDVALRLLEVVFDPELPESHHGPPRPNHLPQRDPDLARDQARDNGTFRLTDFQEDAVRRAERILERRRGVLIADSVGLGKTYIALALVDRALRHGARVAVTTPASLRRDWIAGLRRLHDAHGLSDHYGLTSPNNEHRNFKSDTGHSEFSTRPFLAWVSHTGLSRDTAPLDRLREMDLVVVDEAHAFRNPNTRRYRALAELCRPASVVLVSATPVNNSLWDLYFQIRLFAGDDAFRDLGIPDLADAVRAAAQAGHEGSAGPLRPVLDEIVIRRTRGDVLAGRGGGVARPGSPAVTDQFCTFPHRAPPRAIRYTLEGVYPGFFDELTGLLTRLTLAPFRLGDYGFVPDRGHPVPNAPAELIRLGLLKRLESSIAALRASLRRQIRYLEGFIASLDRGVLRLPADHRAVAHGATDAEQLVLDEVAFRPLPPGLDAARLRDDVENDLTRLRDLHLRLCEIGPGADPKLRRLHDLLDGELEGAKVIVFTEFRDTARYLWRERIARGATGLVDGGGARLGAAVASRGEVLDRFAPRARHAPEPPEHERVDLLIATDVLSEGLNLQDAGHVVDYDLPWNPVRLIQRVGRIDRLGSPYDVIRTWHFVPERGLERLLGITARLHAKLAAIGRTVGRDGPVLPDGHAAAEDQAAAARPVAAPDLRTVVERLAAGDPRAFDDVDSGTPSPLRDASPLERLRAAYRRVAAAREGERLDEAHQGSPVGGTPPAPAERTPSAPVDRTPPAPSQRTPPAPTPRAHPTPAERTPPPPPAAVLHAPGAMAHQVLFAFRAGGRVLLVCAKPGRDPVITEVASVADLLAVALDDRSAAPAPVDSAIVRPLLDAARKTARDHIARTRGGGRLPPHTPNARAARALRRALATCRHPLDPDLCRRADALLHRLARRHDAGTEARLRDVVDAIRPRSGASARTPTDARATTPTTASTALEAAISLLDALEAALHGSLEPATECGPSPTTRPPPAPELLAILEIRPVATQDRAAPGVDVTRPIG